MEPSIGIGPEDSKPSWEWVGVEVGRELSKYYKTSFFRRRPQEPLPHDLVVLIKARPRSRFLENMMPPRAKVAYCPVDHYRSLSHVEEDADFLRRCHAIIVHCERLLPVFKPYCPIVEFVEHHNRFGLPQPVEYKADGYLVWVGGIQHLRRATEWLQKNPLGREIKFVTDYPEAFNDRLRNVLPISDPHEIIQWSPENQAEVMRGAKAAFDIKGLDFNQLHKPPVKAQQFIASGIPFATNPESYSTDYFAKMGFRLPSPDETDYWLSADYWKETQRIRDELCGRLTLEKVGLDFRRLIEKLLYS